MIRRVMGIILIVFISLCSTSCSPAGKPEMISAPENKDIIIKGMWEIHKILPAPDEEIPEEEATRWLGKTAAFDGQIAVLGEDFTTDPMFKVRNVNADEYLLYQFKVDPKYIGTDNLSLQVVTVTSDNKFFAEFIRMGDDEIITNIGGAFLYFKRISYSINQALKENYLRKEAGDKAPGETEKGGQLLAGLLLGLRSEDDNESYRTIWIPFRENEVGNVYETADLFVPRKNGFWKVGVKRTGKGKDFNDEIFAYQAGKEVIGTEEPNSYPLPSRAVTILYAGNDYISTEFGIPDGEGQIKKQLQVLPVDNIENALPVTISDIAGEAGAKALHQGADKALASLDPNKYIQYLSPQEESFALIRRNGRWMMKGRLYDQEKMRFLDFNINVVPPFKLVRHDELYISWNSVKLSVPDAIDVCTSPNKNIAVVITNSSILVYPIEDKRLSGKPLRKINLKNSETVVMAEWAMGSYVDTWEKQFVKDGNYKVIGKK
ncbi:hypothetical protein OXPF_08870 [Oxobacter pfennigii]|uniref:Lipoprotein n=1 Tax=Oxobacter pfennigii TaxID=36849 RepID=A0A0P8X4D9_9CLOT|nr:hypothetical protein [Oxobacter pfennigii]KPU45654.1 hypothetical protein OXPF_08870 [Oxobacter pfennigii]